MGWFSAITDVVNPAAIMGGGGGGGGTGAFGAGSSGSGSAASNSGFGSKQSMSESTTYTESASSTTSTDRRVVADGGATVINAETGTTLNLQSDAAALDLVRQVSEMSASNSLSLIEKMANSYDRANVTTANIWGNALTAVKEAGVYAVSAERRVSEATALAAGEALEGAEVEKADQAEKFKKYAIGAALLVAAVLIYKRGK